MMLNKLLSPKAIIAIIGGSLTGALITECIANKKLKDENKASKEKIAKLQEDVNFKNFHIGVLVDRVDDLKEQIDNLISKKEQ